MGKTFALTRLLHRAGGAVLAAALLGCGPSVSDSGRGATSAVAPTAATPTASAPAAATPAAATTTVSVAQLPTEAQQTLRLIQRGGPFPFRKDGAVFSNRERLLPQRPRGYYTEYTVRTPDARDRGARRIVAGRGTAGDPATSGEYYYTEDHYNTFWRIRE